MIIKKISKFNNIFSYSYFGWDSVNSFTFINNDNSSETRDGHFLKYNIFFAENGNGKSKLVQVFKSLNGEPQEIEKHRDRQDDNQEVEIILNDDSQISFDGSKWCADLLKNKFIIFDRHFTERYVHSTGTEIGDNSLRRQQRGKNIIYLGNFDEYNCKIDRINNLRQTISIKNTSFIHEQELKIKSIITAKSINLEELLRDKLIFEKLDLQSLSEKEDKLLKTKEELKSLEKAIKEKEKIKSLSQLSKISKNISLTIKIDDDGIKKDFEIDPNTLFLFTLTFWSSRDITQD